MTRLKKIIERFEITMTAISFAEAGEMETARELMETGKKEQRQKRERIMELNDLSIKTAHSNLK